MLGAVYTGYVIPLIFLIMVIKGETRGIIVSMACGMSAVIVVYVVTGFINEEYIPASVQIVYLIPVMEELLKALPLFIMARIAGKSLNLKFALTRYAIAIGLGFSILENNLYLSITETAGLGSSVVFMMLRGFTSSLVHGSTCTLVGLFLQIMRNRNYFSLFLCAAALLMGIFIHSLYNLLWQIPGLVLFALILPVGIFMILLFLFDAYERKASGQNRGSLPSR